MIFSFQAYSFDLFNQKKILSTPPKQITNTKSGFSHSENAVLVKQPGTATSFAFDIF